MKLELDVNRIDGSRAVTIAYADFAQVDQLIACIDESGEIDGDSILSLALESETTLPPTMPVKDLQFKHTSLKVHAACVEVHFESEEHRHHFPVEARWSRVHRWACRHFTIAHDACANLELRLGSQDGPLLNERKEIGRHSDCVVVWLVKPGPEPNGASR